jgi:murein DD-endopeptidase MepM/ murein hydrolase activator NlpD
MRKININLPKYRLFLQFRLIRRRRSTVAEPLIPTPKIVRGKYRKGSFIGRFFRHIFEHKKINKVLAGGISLVVITASYFPPSGSVLAQDFTNETIIESQVTLTTEKSVQYPTKEVKVTQGYAFYHPGIDFDGLTGDPIKPIKPGKVSAVSYSKFAYGNSVLIEHANGVSSLYAHLSKIEVQAGQEVTMETEIGEMGATGRSFGDHLHLEVYDHGKSLNPLTVLR